MTTTCISYTNEESPDEPDTPVVADRPTTGKSTMPSLANAKVGDLITRPERHSNFKYVLGADAPWRIHQITAVTPAYVWVGETRIRKKDGLVLGTGGSHGRIEHAQLATPEMVQQAKDAASLHLRASAALQRLRSASDVISGWKIYASGTPATKEHQPGLRKDLPAVDGITLDQAERLLAALDDIMKPPKPAQSNPPCSQPTGLAGAAPEATQ